MALSGTIETFALPDVLRLLASTKKTGCLRLDGSRGAGAIWVDGGAIVGGEATGAPHADGAAEVLFELLRFKEGDFEFEADSTPDSAAPAAEVEPTLEAAEAMLEEWKGIEAVVPSLDHWVELNPELPGDEVTVSADRWKSLVAVAGGTSVGRLGDELSLGELPVSRSVKELVELGLVRVDEPRDDVEPVIAAVEVVEVEAEPLAAPEPAFEADADVFDPDALVIEEPPLPTAAESSSLSAADAAAAAAPPVAPDATDAAEIARQLANLSPKAAKAVAAAAKATTPEEREAALAEVDDEEDPINRDLLIKFLGSVSS
ncbi:MAG: DUF4388 domain-containing protein [Acidimicrobiales bacterium]